MPKQQETQPSQQKHEDEDGSWLTEKSSVLAALGKMGVLPLAEVILWGVLMALLDIRDEFKEEFRADDEGEGQRAPATVIDEDGSLYWVKYRDPASPTGVSISHVHAIGVASIMEHFKVKGFKVLEIDDGT